MLDRRNVMMGMLVSGTAIGTRASGAAAFAVAESVPSGPWEEEGTVVHGGGVLHWAAMGRGPTVVLTPKLGGWIADWRHVAPLLATRFRVLAIDPPGHGGSVMAAAAPFAYTLPESAAVIRAALQELGVQRYAFVGNSLGGCIGFVMAALWPDEVTHLVPISATLMAGKTREEVVLMDAAEPAGLYDKDWNPLPRSFERVNDTFGMTRQIADEMNASRAAAGRWVRSSQRGVALADLPAYLPRIGAPTLLVYGSTGPYPKFRETGLARIRHAKAATIANGGSFVHQQKPQETAKTIIDFLSD
jgi:pimeloyl-ACP methyl ester carboxylesterase